MDERGQADDAMDASTAREPQVELSPPESAPELTPEPAPEPAPEAVSEVAPEGDAIDGIADGTPKQSWTPAACPQPGPNVTVGTRVGQFLQDLTLYDCDGKPVKLSDFCGASALWLSLHHAWCPHCQLLRDTMEPIHARYASKGLATVSIVVQSSSRSLPTKDTCRRWRQDGKHNLVYTLYDPTFSTRILWEQNYTALNVFVNRSRVITGKMHTDRESDLRNQLDKALAP